MSATAIICGSDLSRYPALGLTDRVEVTSQYGAISASVLRSTASDKPLFFLARHGQDSSVPPHLINYRANIDALSKLGVKQVIALNTVGGLGIDYAPGFWAMPDQIIDYSFGREQTFFNGVDEPMQHIDFSFPFADSLRNDLMSYLKKSGLNLCLTIIVQGSRMKNRHTRHSNSRRL